MRSAERAGKPSEDAESYRLHREWLIEEKIREKGAEYVQAGRERLEANLDVLEAGGVLMTDEEYREAQAKGLPIRRF